MKARFENAIVELGRFAGREQALRKIKRYSLYKVMFYRTNLFTHSKRVSWIVREIVPFATEVYGKDFDAVKVVLMALVHDDHEIIMGDVQRGNKNKMNELQKTKLRQREERALHEVAARFPKRIDNYRYQDLLWSAHRLDCLEALVVEFSDKLEAFAEALHEVFAGNYIFAENVTNEYGTIEIPFVYYIPYLSSFAATYPDMSPLFKQAFPLFQKPIMLDFHKLALNHKPHTKQSLTEQTGFMHYDQWKRIVMKHADDEELRNLYVQKEFHK